VEGESSFIAHGGAILDGWTPQKIHGRIELKNGTLVSATPELRLRLDGNLEVEGDLDLLVVTGDLDLAQGRVVLDAASFLEVAPLSLDPRLQVERGVVRTLQVDRSDQDVDLRMLDVDVAVDLGRNLELDLSMPFLDDYGSFGRLVGRLDLDARLGGEMNVGVSEGDVSLVGELDIHDGLLGVLRSRFDLESSTITFVGGDYSEPALNIAAKMDTGADVVELKVSGTPSYPDISFTSETLADENEILLTLITGRAPSDLDTTQAQGATSALAGLVLNSLLGGAGSFSIEPDGSIRAGIPVSPDLYATTLAHPTPEAGENAFTVIIDWSLAPRLVASTGLGDQRQSADLYWEHRF
jgi:autotransporter translocation and assembly factor TamB